ALLGRIAPGAIPAGVFTALAAVGQAADQVHRHGQRLVGLGGQRPVRHGAGREALCDRQSGLNLRDRDGWAGGDQLQQVAQLGDRPLVDEGGELVVQLVPAGGDCPLQQVRRLHVVEGVDDVLVVGVVLATPLQVAVVAGVG